MFKVALAFIASEARQLVLSFIRTGDELYMTQTRFLESRLIGTRAIRFWSFPQQLIVQIQFTKRRTTKFEI